MKPHSSDFIKRVFCWLSAWLSFQITKVAEIIKSPAWTHQLSLMRAEYPSEYLIVLVLTLPKRSTAFNDALTSRVFLLLPVIYLV